MDDIGWIIIVVSGAVVLGATLLRIHQVRSRQGTAASTFTKELTEGLEEASQHHADRPEEQPAGKPADSPSDPPSVPQATDDAGRGSRSDR
jgi:Sec-independent protein translocase protein TatA